MGHTVYCRWRFLGEEKDIQAVRTFLRNNQTVNERGRPIHVDFDAIYAITSEEEIDKTFPYDGRDYEAYSFEGTGDQWYQTNWYYDRTDRVYFYVGGHHAPTFFYKPLSLHFPNVTFEFLTAGEFETGPSTKVTMKNGEVLSEERPEQGYDLHSIRLYYELTEEDPTKYDRDPITLEERHSDRPLDFDFERHHFKMVIFEHPEEWNRRQIDLKSIWADAQLKFYDELFTRVDRFPDRETFLLSLERQALVKEINNVIFTQETLMHEGAALTLYHVDYEKGSWVHFLIALTAGHDGRIIVLSDKMQFADTDDHELVAHEKDKMLNKVSLEMYSGNRDLIQLSFRPNHFVKRPLEQVPHKEKSYIKLQVHAYYKTGLGFGDSKHYQVSDFESRLNQSLPEYFWEWHHTQTENFIKHDRTHYRGDFFGDSLLEKVQKQWGAQQWQLIRSDMSYVNKNHAHDMVYEIESEQSIVPLVEFARHLKQKYDWQVNFVKIGHRSLWHYDTELYGPVVVGETELGAWAFYLLKLCMMQPQPKQSKEADK